jgi:hypothetical protein
MTEIKVGIDQSLDLIQHLDWEFAPPCESQTFHDPVNHAVGTRNTYLGPVEEAKWNINMRMPDCTHFYGSLRCQKCLDHMLNDTCPVIICPICDARNPGPIRHLITSINPIK